MYCVYTAYYGSGGCYYGIVNLAGIRRINLIECLTELQQLLKLFLFESGRQMQCSIGWLWGKWSHCRLLSSTRALMLFNMLRYSINIHTHAVLSVAWFAECCEFHLPLVLYYIHCVVITILLGIHIVHFKSSVQCPSVYTVQACNVLQRLILLKFFYLTRDW